MSTGALLGLMVGSGILLVFAGLAATRRPRLVDRVGPRSARIALQDRGPAGTLLELLQPVMAVFIRALGRDSDRGSALAKRLRQSGRDADIERYRLEQLVWAGAGAIAGLILTGVVIAQRTEISGALAAVLVALCAGASLLLHDRRLSAAVRRRGRAMSEQLPTVAELLAFAVSAGEAPLAAIERVSRLLSGELSDELARLVSTVRGGTPFLVALRSMGDACPSADVSRFVDGLAVATERGTPITDVLRSQAADARAAARRSLLESAGKKEILMLMPVVFFILPIVVVIALFPGIHGLQLTVP